MSVSGKAALGGFLIGGLLLFAIGLFWIGDRRQLFTDSVDLYTEFSNVSGLSRGAKVRISGLDAGEVLDIGVPLEPDSRFRVHFRAISRFLPILRMDSLASIQNDGLVGNKFLQIQAGTSAAQPVSGGVTIPSREPIEISDVLSQAMDTVKSANQGIVRIQNGVDDSVKSVLSISAQTAEIISDVGKQVDRFTITGNRITEDFQAIISNARNGQGSVGKLLNDDQLYEQLRSAANEGGQVAQNFKLVSDDLKVISEDLKARHLGTKIEEVAGSLNTLTKEAITAVQSFRNPDSTTGGLMADVRQTLSSANEAMANFADNGEALKRNFLFRGFFNQRGFFDLDAVTVRDYKEGRVLADRQKVSEWLDAPQLFTPTADGHEQLTEEGKRQLDVAMASFLQYSKTDPLVIESWAGSGNEPERVLRARQRAIMVSEYLVEKFALKPSYVATMPMNAGTPSSDRQSRDGIGLVLFAPKAPRR
jgi:phospholipid/cholesterol/gamma-HCH transport system substrate-binding protein